MNPWSKARTGLNLETFPSGILLPLGCWKPTSTSCAVLAVVGPWHIFDLTLLWKNRPNFWGSGEYFGTLLERWLTCGRRHGVLLLIDCSSSHVWSAVVRYFFLTLSWIEWSLVFFGEKQQATTWRWTCKQRALFHARFKRPDDKVPNKKRPDAVISVKFGIFNFWKHLFSLGTRPTGDLSMLTELHEKGARECLNFSCGKLKVAHWRNGNRQTLGYQRNPKRLAVQVANPRAASCFQDLPELYDLLVKAYELATETFTPTPPKFNSKSHWKMLVGRRSFPIGAR